MKKATVLLMSTILIAICISITVAAPAKTYPANGKLKIFILSGQSNMVGFGQLAGSPGTMETYLKSNPKDYGHLVDNNGKHVIRNDVWIVNLSYEEQKGWLTTGYGASASHIGPEYAFGFIMGDYFEDPVLLIKSAWGGRSLHRNFLSPSSADYPTPKADGDTGFQYAGILRHVKIITSNVKKYYPSYSGKGYEIIGFGWHQGWNDRINQDAVNVYEKNMERFIKDIRKDLGIEKLPFIIANTGMGGWTIPITARYKKKVEKLMAVQLALANTDKYPEFKGNVGGVETRDFQRTREESPSRQDYHWYRNWETLYLIGKGMGDSMVDLLSHNLSTWEQTMNTAILKAKALDYNYIIDHLLAQDLVDTMTNKYGTEHWKEVFQKKHLRYLLYYFGWLKDCKVEISGDKVFLIGQHGCYTIFINVNGRYLLFDFGQRITSM